MAKPLLEERGHELAVDVPRGIAVDGDPARLAQVAANQLTNAAKYTEPGGRVWVHAGAAGVRRRNNARWSTQVYDQPPGRRHAARATTALLGLGARAADAAARDAGQACSASWYARARRSRISCSA